MAKTTVLSEKEELEKTRQIYSQMYHQEEKDTEKAVKTLKKFVQRSQNKEQSTN